MRALVKFAGFDPAEDDFDGVEPAPLHDDEPKRRKTSIDIARAWDLKRAGLSWHEIGAVLAQEMGRKIAFQGLSVRAAAHYCIPKRKGAA